MFRFLLCCLLLLPGYLTAQPESFANIRNTPLENYKLINSQYFDGKSLWGYMNGGADLYLEYGFEGLLVQEINYKGISVKCEIYKMNDVPSAFGIFSIQRHNCRTNSDWDNPHCINNYQVQVVCRDYYLSLINPIGDTIARKVTEEVALTFAHTLGKENVVYPEINIFGEQNQRLIRIEGNIALGNVYPQALAYMENISGYSMWLLPSGKKTPVISLITFDNEADLKKYTEAAFPGQQIEKSAEVKLKKGEIRSARKLGDNKILQAEGKIGKEMKKMLLF